MYNLGLFAEIKKLKPWTWKRQFPTCERPLLTETVKQWRARQTV